MCNKQPLTKRDAKAALKLAKVGKRYRKERRMYFCTFHNAWHLTSQVHTHPVIEVEPVEKERWDALLIKTESLP